MPARSAAAWEAGPDIPATHFVSGLVYTDETIFEEEKRHVFGKTWQLACHESELPEPFDFRTFFVADQPLVSIRGADGRIRTFLNVCSHRGAQLVREPSGNAERFTCFYHLWSYDSSGACIDIPRAEGFEDSGLKQEDCGLREVRTETKLGLVFVNLDDGAEPLDAFFGEALNAFEPVMGSGELEVFHFHRAILDANWKAWIETNLDLYHELMHVTLRKTQVTAGKMEDRQFLTFPNGHAEIGGVRAKYDGYEGWGARESSKTLPGLDPADLVVVDIFPNSTLVARGTVLRIDTVVPLGAGKAVLECRGIGRKGDSGEDRIMRIDHHNAYWGPFGRNLPEDAIAAGMCGASFRPGAARHQIIARDEDGHGQDDALLRNFYAEWGPLMGRPAHNPINQPSV